MMQTIKTTTGKALCLLGAMAAIAFSPLALSQAYPSKPVTIISPYPVGGGGDMMLRSLAQELSTELNQSVVIDAKPGAGTTISAAYVARAPADGYTLLMGVTQQAVAPSLFKNLPYNFVTSLTPVSVFADGPFILVVRPGLRIDNLSQLIALIKEKGDSMNFGSSGPGGIPHLAGAALNKQAGAKVTHVPFTGTAPAFAALLGDQIDYMFADVSALPSIQAGKVKAIGVTTDKRISALPAVPAMSETLPGFVMSSWVAIDAPAGTPRPVIDRLNAAIQKASKSAALTQRYETISTRPLWTTPEQYGAFKAAEMQKYDQLVKEFGIKLD